MRVKYVRSHPQNPCKHATKEYRMNVWGLIALVIIVLFLLAIFGNGSFH